MAILLRDRNEINDQLTDLKADKTKLTKDLENMTDQYSQSEKRV